MATYWILPSKLGNKALSIFIQFTRIPSQCYKEMKRNKMLTDWKEKRKWPLFIHSMIIYVEIPKNLRKSEFNKLTWNKVNAPKPILCLYVSNRELKIKLNEQYYSKCKYLVINLQNTYKSRTLKTIKHF